MKGSKALTVDCPTCGARRGELCAEPTRAQVEDGLPAGVRWAGRVRQRSHSSRVDLVEHLEQLRDIDARGKGQ